MLKCEAWNDGVKGAAHLLRESMSVHVESEPGHGCCYKLPVTIIISYFTHHTDPCLLLKGEHGVEAGEQGTFSLVFLKCGPSPPTPILDQWLPQENVKVT